MKLRRGISRRHERGSNFLETAGALLVVAMIGAGIFVLMADNARTVKAQSNAEKLRTITETAERYISTYQTDLAGAVSGGGTIAIPVGRRCVGCAQPPAPSGFQTIQEAGFLPSSFVDVNGNQQSHALLVQRSPSGGVEAIVTTYGGSRMSDEDIGQVSSMLGAAGGGVFSNASIGPTNRISGVHGGWGDATSNWNASIGGTNVRPSSGTVQVSMDLAGIAGLGGVDQTKYLHRTAQTDTSLNGMETDLSMDVGGSRNDITGVGSLTARTLNAEVMNDTSGGTWTVNPSHTSQMNVINAQRADLGSTRVQQRLIRWGGNGTIQDTTTFDGSGDVNYNNQGDVHFRNTVDLITFDTPTHFNRPASFTQGIRNDGSGPLRIRDDLIIEGNSNLPNTLTVGTVNANSLTSGSNVDVANDVNVSRDVNAANNIRAGNDVRASRDVVASRNLVSNTDIESARHITAVGNVNGLNVIADSLVRGANANIAGLAKVGTLAAEDNVQIKGTLRALGNATVATTLQVGDEVRSENLHTNHLTVGDVRFSSNLMSSDGAGNVDGLMSLSESALNFDNGSSQTQITGGRLLTTGYVRSDSVQTYSMYFRSDRRLKTDIKDLEDEGMINKLRPREFRWKKDGKKSLGFIAQEVEKDFPELVMTDEDSGMKSVRYTDLIAPLVAKAQATDAKIESLEERLEILEAAR